MNKYPSFFILLLIISFNLPSKAQEIRPIPYAHAHNDYEHDRPLLDALANGFTSIEVDVFAIDGELYAYHNRPSLPDPARTLRLLYLEPLQQRIAKHGGQVYSSYSGRFQLMIDIKTEAETTYALIKKQLIEYQNLFQRIENGREIAGPIMVFLSGNRPIETILESDTHIAKLDGRPEDLGKGYSTTKMPVISDRYGKIIKWNGKGRMSKKQRKQLKGLIKSVHKEEKQLRLWAMPEEEEAWQTFLKLGMDWLNADDLGRLQTFHQKRR